MKGAMSIDAVWNRGAYCYSQVINPERLLGDPDTNLLLEDLRVVASHGFGRNVSLDSLRRHAIEGQSHLFLAASLMTGQIVAFAGIKAYQEIANGLLFLTGIAVLPEYQGQGIGRCLMQKVTEATSCQQIALTTQSPRMYSLMLSLAKSLLPSVDGALDMVKAQTIATLLMVGRRSGALCPSSWVVKDLYDHCLYQVFPWCSNMAVNGFFRKSLHFVNGGTRDGFFLLGAM